MQTSHRSQPETSTIPPGGGQPWLSSAAWDSTWILAPSLVSTAIVWIFRGPMLETQNIPLWVWVCFVLLIDVAHVYGTLFRTYLSPQAFSKNKTILLAIPAIAWIGGSLLYSIDGLYFWRALAYLAVFHFIRQQYGFMVMYSRKEPEWSKKYRWIDGAVFYMATIYPLLYWHTHPRNFSWFVAGDFFSALPHSVDQLGLICYAVASAAYLIKTILLAKEGTFNLPKNLLLLGTALSWWVGIIAVNSDMAFTITNVVSHGIPYMALIWLYHGGKQFSDGEEQAKKPIATLKAKWPIYIMSNAIFFFAFLCLLAYLEEGLWDGLLWREHLGVFAPFTQLPQIADPAFLALLVPFLALPQSTHYLLDGFIWRVRERNNIWST